MKLRDYLHDQVSSWLLNIIGVILLSVFLYSAGNDSTIIILIDIVWFCILLMFYLIDFYNKKIYYSQLLELMEELKDKYLIAEVMNKPKNLEGKIYSNLLKQANKSMMEKITETSSERKEYREYVEQWVHEIKTPIAAAKLLCDNNKSNLTNKISLEIIKIQYFVEQTLFYARSEKVEKDYLIREILLNKIIHNTISVNKEHLLYYNITVNVEENYETVYTDPKWLEFILKQILMNAVQYKKNQDANVIFRTFIVQNGIQLHITDNGIGIREEDLYRIFEKGFTGNNGRIGGHSTGIGLYLCKRLCDKLGLKISVESRLNEYTTVIIFFPKGTFIKFNDN